MTDIVPMLLSEPTELEARLLQAADDDEPGAEALERVGAALGISAAALAAASASSVLAAQAAVAGHAVALSKPLTLVSLAKWLAVGIGVGMATGGVAQIASRAVESEPPVVAPAAVVAPARNVAPLSAQPRSDLPYPAPEPAPEVSATPPASTATFPPLPAAAAVPEPALTAAPVHTGSASFDAPEAKPGTESPASTLGDETKALDRARQALAAGDARDALGALDTYRAKWPKGALRAEASLLRVDALLRSGNRPAAEREANALISAAPASRYATRARALLGAKPE
jgi:hypothetical protein